MSFSVSLQTITIGEIPINLFVPDEAAVKRAYKQGKIPFPYWSKVWPSAIALSEFIVRHPHYILNKNLAEIGSGLGLPSLIAACNAKSVLCTDNVAEAVVIAQQSAAHNGLANFKTAVLDWHHLPDNTEVDVLLLSDVNYEPVSFDALLTVLNKFLQKNTTIILSTPQRLMAKDFIAPLLHHCIDQQEMTISFSGETIQNSVFVLR